MSYRKYQNTIRRVSFISCSSYTAL